MSDGMKAAIVGAIITGICSIIAACVGGPAILALMAGGSNSSYTPNNSVGQTNVSNPPTQPPPQLQPADTPIPPQPVDTPTPIPSPTPDQSILFEDNFEYGIKPDWKPVYGEWKMVDDRFEPTKLIDQGKGEGNSTSVLVGNPNWNNYKVEFDAGNLNVGMYRLSSISINIRVQNPETYMMFYTDGQNATCGKKINGSDQEISKKKVGLGFEGPHHLSVSAKNSTYEFWINSTKICIVNDTTFSSGQVGLTAYNMTISKPWIDNFKVKALP